MSIGITRIGTLIIGIMRISTMGISVIYCIPKRVRMCDLQITLRNLLETIDFLL